MLQWFFQAGLHKAKVPINHLDCIFTTRSCTHTHTLTPAQTCDFKTKSNNSLQVLPSCCQSCWQKVPQHYISSFLTFFPFTDNFSMYSLERNKNAKTIFQIMGLSCLCFWNDGPGCAPPHASPRLPTPPHASPSPPREWIKCRGLHSDLISFWMCFEKASMCGTQLLCRFSLYPSPPSRLNHLGWLHKGTNGCSSLKSISGTCAFPAMMHN